jgi:hypothetical protein
VGATSCAGCHPKKEEAYRTSDHAGAMQPVNAMRGATTSMAGRATGWTPRQRPTMDRMKAEMTPHSIRLFRGDTYAVRPCAAWALACALALPCASIAAEQDATALAKAVQNPVADLISVPFQYNANFEFGPLEKTQHVLNIQPVYPIKLSSEWNLITRTIVPLIST